MLPGAECRLQRRQHRRLLLRSPFGTCKLDDKTYARPALVIFLHLPRWEPVHGLLVRREVTFKNKKLLLAYI